jgi:hypothetical protein
VVDDFDAEIESLSALDREVIVVACFKPTASSIVADGVANTLLADERNEALQAAVVFADLDERRGEHLLDERG